MAGVSKAGTSPVVTTPGASWTGKGDKVRLDVPVASQAFVKEVEQFEGQVVKANDKQTAIVNAANKLFAELGPSPLMQDLTTKVDQLALIAGGLPEGERRQGLLGIADQLLKSGSQQIQAARTAQLKGTPSEADVGAMADELLASMRAFDPTQLDAVVQDMMKKNPRVGQQLQERGTNILKERAQTAFNRLESLTGALPEQDIVAIGTDILNGLGLRPPADVVNGKVDKLMALTVNRPDNEPAFATIAAVARQVRAIGLQGAPR